MLHVYRRHEGGCKLKNRVTEDKSRPKRKDGPSSNCPVWIRGALRDGTPVTRQSLNTRVWPLSEEIAAWELGHPIGQPPNSTAVLAARARFQESVLVFQQVNDTARESLTLNGLVGVLSRQCHLVGAGRAYEEPIIRFRQPVRHPSGSSFTALL